MIASCRAASRRTSVAQSSPAWVCTASGLSTTRDHLERKIGGPSALCQRTNGYQVNTRFRVGPDGGEGDPPRSFEQHLASGPGHRFGDEVGSHVVKQNRVGAGGQGFVEAVEIGDLDFDQ